MLSLFLRFRRFLRPYRWRLAAGFLALTLSVGADLLLPWPMKLIVDSVLGDHPLPAWFPTAVTSGSDDVRIGALCLALLGIAAVGALLTYTGTYLSESVGQRLTFDIREVAHVHLHRLSLAYHHSQRPGDLLNRLTGDIDRIQSVLVAVLETLGTSALTIVGMLAVMVYVNWEFTLLAFAVTPLLFFTVYRYTTRIKHSARHARKQEGRVAAVVHETLSAIELVQAYTREGHELERFRREAAGSLESNLRATMLQARFSPVVDLLSAAATALVLWFGAHQVLDGSLTLGLLLVFLSYLRGFYRPVRQLSKLSYLVSRGTAAAERLSDLLEAAPSLPAPDRPSRPRKVQGALRFEDVWFTYPLADEPALRGVSFTVEPGQAVALVGPTGAGKSTIASLLPRFYDVAAGTVSVDGLDVRQWELGWLRNQISLVLQHTWLFQTSVRENIAYGRPGATSEEIQEVAVAANAHEFIERLPDGYDTVVGPRGATLSGGQRQRIAVARAMLRPAPILILDEPTVGLDPASERLVLEGLRRLASARTAIVIAHGEAPVIAADEILLVAGGKIRERGTYEELRGIGLAWDVVSSPALTAPQARA